MAQRHPTDPFGDGSLLESWIFNPTPESQQPIINSWRDYYSFSTTNGSQEGYGYMLPRSSDPKAIPEVHWLIGDGNMDVTIVFAIDCRSYAQSSVFVAGSSATRYNVEFVMTWDGSGQLDIDLYQHKRAVTTTVQVLDLSEDWHYVFYRYDSVTNTSSISVDDGASLGGIAQIMLWNDSKFLEAYSDGVLSGLPYSDIQYYNKVLSDTEAYKIVHDFPTTFVYPNTLEIPLTLLWGTDGYNSPSSLLTTTVFDALAYSPKTVYPDSILMEVMANEPIFYVIASPDISPLIITQALFSNGGYVAPLLNITIEPLLPRFGLFEAPLIDLVIEGLLIQTDVTIQPESMYIPMLVRWEPTDRGVLKGYHDAWYTETSTANIRGDNPMAGVEAWRTYVDGCGNDNTFAHFYDDNTTTYMTTFRTMGLNNHWTVVWTIAIPLLTDSQMGMKLHSADHNVMVSIAKFTDGDYLYLYMDGGSSIMLPITAENEGKFLKFATTVDDSGNVQTYVDGEMLWSLTGYPSVLNGGYLAKRYDPCTITDIEVYDAHANHDEMVFLTSANYCVTVVIAEPLMLKLTTGEGTGLQRNSPLMMLVAPYEVGVGFQDISMLLIVTPDEMTPTVVPVISTIRAYMTLMRPTTLQYYEVPTSLVVRVNTPSVQPYIAQADVLDMTLTILNDNLKIEDVPMATVEVLLVNYVGEVASGDTSGVYVVVSSIFLPLFLNYSNGAYGTYPQAPSQKLDVVVLEPTLTENVHPIYAPSLEVVLNSAIAVTNLTPTRLKRVVSIGGVVFDYPLFWSHTTDPRGFLSTKEYAIDGATIVSVMPYRQWSQGYWIFTNNDIIVSETVVQQLREHVDAEEHLLVFTDGSTQIVKYDLTITPLSIENATNEWHYVTIKVLF